VAAPVVEGLAAEVAVLPILRHSILDNRLRQGQEKEQKPSRASILSLGTLTLTLPARSRFDGATELPVVYWRSAVSGPRFQGFETLFRNPVF
jgi:hypothetical protein